MERPRRQAIKKRTQEIPRNREREAQQLKKLIDEADEKNNQLDKELQEIGDSDKDKKALCEEQQRKKKWIEDVRKAMSEGEPMPDKPEGIEIGFPGYHEEENCQEEATAPQGTSYKVPPPEVPQ